MATRQHIPKKNQAAVIQRNSLVGRSLNAAEHEAGEDVPAGVDRVVASRASRGLILEWVRELDYGLREVADVLISWRKV